LDNKFPQIIATLFQNILYIFYSIINSSVILPQCGNWGAARAWGVREECASPQKMKEISFILYRGKNEFRN